MNHLEVFSVLICFAFSSCGSTHTPAQQGTVKGLAAISGGNNQAVLISSPSNLAGFIDIDLNTLQTILPDPALNYNFKVQTKNHAHLTDVMSLVGSAAAAVGESGTLLLYFGAHGSPQGDIALEDGNFFRWDQIASTIEKARNGKKFRRVTMIIGSCYSGSWIPNIQRRPSDAFQEIVVMTTVTSQYESVIVQGRGSPLVQTLAIKFREHKNDHAITMGAFADEVKQYQKTNFSQNFNGSYHDATPVIYFSPDSIKDEKLQADGSSTSTSTSTSTTTPDTSTATENTSTKPSDGNVSGSQQFVLDGKIYTCPAGTVLYTDGQCHATAPSSESNNSSGAGQTPPSGGTSNDFILNGIRYSCPQGTSLYTDGTCHANSSTGGQQSQTQTTSQQNSSGSNASNDFILGGMRYTCPAGTSLYTDGYCR